MPRSRTLLAFATIAAISAGLAAQGSSCEDLKALDVALPQALGAARVVGMCMQVTKSGLVRYEKAFGAYTIDEVVQIASASKWMSAACIMTLVDQGKIKLDDKVSKYLPSFTGLSGEATIRQCLSHTTGMVQEDGAIELVQITLSQCVDALATKPLESSPGATFAYGEVSFQVAGRCAEVASGKSWATLFQSNIATPLGLGKTDYQAFGATSNPRIGAGARSCLRDYGTFLQMLLNNGMHGPLRILQPASVQEMLTDQTRGAFLKTQPYPQRRLYGLGCWRDREEGNGLLLQASCQGVYGFSPWIDFERRMTGVLLMHDNLEHVYYIIDQLQTIVRNYITPIGVSCLGYSTYACSTPILQNAWAVPHGLNPGFGVMSFAQPAGSPGVAVLGTRLWASGWMLLGARVYLDFAGPIVTFPVSSTGIGECYLPLPLPAVTPGAKYYTQFFWPKPASCGTGLGASNALTLIMQ